MRKTAATSWGRMALAFAAVLLVAGPGLVLAVIPANYAPKTSTLLGPSSVAPGGSANFSLQVTFTNGDVANFPGDTPGPSDTLLFSAVRGSITQAGAYTAPVAPPTPKDKVSGTFTHLGVTVSSVKIIDIK